MTDPKPFTWHPSLGHALRDRPVLREARQRDGHLAHHLQLLDLFLKGLQRHMPDAWLADALVDDLLPSDRELSEQQALQAAAIRDLETNLGRGFELLVQSGVATVVTPDEAAAGTDSDRPLAPLGWTRRCPECTAGKHINCTGEALDDHDQLAPCTCTSTLHPIDTAALSAAPEDQS